LKTAEKIEEKAIIDVCPLCGSVMEKGFIITRKIDWNRKEHKFFDIGEEIVPPSWHLANVEAHRCKKCKLVIFRYGEAGNPAEGSL
jgi:hypothetical protein